VTQGSPSFHFHPSPGLAKARACLALLSASGSRDASATYAALFLADASHLSRHGRSLYGETWIRGTADGPPVTGLLARALLADDAPELAGSDITDLTSVSDRLALADAASLVDGMAADGVRDLVRASPLHGRGAADTPVDILDGLPPWADRAEAAFMMAHASFGPRDFT